MTNVAILGYGVVGSGVAEVIYKNAEILSAKAGSRLEVKYILDIRDFADDPYLDRIIRDFSIIENDPAVSVVVETIGGKTFAYDFTKRALLAGKHVVTSNKELVAAYGHELLALAREKNLNYLFEASVGGGIPIIRPLSQCLAANRFYEICGILNGTTNYILTRMLRAGLSFDDALREAQLNGYAESNPSADIDGLDTCRKICILSDLAFGKHISPERVYTEGIRNITLEDIRNADSAGMTIKLLGRTVNRDGRLHIITAPHLVPLGNPLAMVEDVFNGIVVKGDAIGETMFYGRGAGKFPTASAVVGDIIDTVKHLGNAKTLYWSSGGDEILASPDSGRQRYYLRFGGTNAAPLVRGILREVKELNVSGHFACITGPLDGGMAADLVKRLEASGSPVLAAIRVIDQEAAVQW